VGLGLLGVPLALLVGWSTASALSEGFVSMNWFGAGPALIAYLCAHALRVCRTVVVLGDSVHSVRSVALAHAASAPWTGLLPFKVGELARMYAIGRVTEGFWHGFRAVWIERTFDAVLIALAVGIAVIIRPQDGAAVLPIGLASVALLGVTGGAVTALPENLATAKLWVLRRYTTPWSLRVLAALDEVGDAVKNLGRLVRGKVATLTVLTGAIWSLELSGLWLLVGQVDRLGEGLVVGMLAILSDVIRPDGGLQLQFASAIESWHAIIFAVLPAMGVVGSVGWMMSTWRRR
jgi:hypothetical protein